MTETVGGVISGYCATGSRNIATAPKRTVRIEITAAAIGRRMKNCVNML